MEVFSLKIANFLSDEPSVSCKMVANNQQGVSGSSSPKEDPFLGKKFSPTKYMFNFGKKILQ